MNLLGDLPGAQVTPEYNAANRMTFDVTDYAWQQYNAGTKSVSFNATQASDIGSSHDFDISSKETADARQLPLIVMTRVKKETAALKTANGATVKVFPTFTDGLLFVQLNASAAYRLFDTQGRLMKNGKLENGINIVDISNCNTGFYLLNIDNVTYTIGKMEK